ncbi:MAG: hypothetical protein ACPG5U_08765 [Planktomarina sp.]|uniref:hypothetical protein n=1 Tax=Halocynthiibacter sp. TaxID=1979210 RepID=UPI003C3B6EE6
MFEKFSTQKMLIGVLAFGIWLPAMVGAQSLEYSGSLSISDSSINDGGTDGSVRRVTALTDLGLGSRFGLTLGLSYTDENYDNENYGVYKGGYVQPYVRVGNGRIGVFYQNLGMQRSGDDPDTVEIYGIEGIYDFDRFRVHGFNGRVEQPGEDGYGVHGLAARYMASDGVSIFVRHQRDRNSGDQFSLTAIGTDINVSAITFDRPAYLTLELADVDYFGDDGKQFGVALTLPFGRDASVNSVPLFKGQRTLINEYN